MTNSDNFLEQLREIIERECRKSSFYTYSAYLHLLRVGKIAKKLAEENGGDPEIAEVAGLLHDIGAVTYGRENHHITGALEAKRILEKLGYPDEKIKRVKHCIFAHRSSIFIKRQTIEAGCVADADAIDHFEQLLEMIEVARATAGMSSADSIGEAKRWLKDKLEKDWKKLTPRSKKVAEKTYRSALNRLESFGQ